MRHTIKDVSEQLFVWLAKLQLGDDSYFPAQIMSWNEKDWNVAKTIVFMHGMGPLWGKKCKNGWCCSHMPDDFRIYLLEQYQKNAIRIKNIQSFYRSLEELLLKKHIDYMPFKGIQLASTIYDDPAVRPMADIDLYVGRANREELPDIFKSLGFSPLAVTESGATFFPEDWLRRSSTDYMSLQTIEDSNDDFYIGESPDSPYGIDVHYEMKIRGFDGLNRIFEDALASSEKNLLTEDYFIYLLLHAAKHFLTRSGRWLHLYDIYLFHKHFKIDCDYIVKRAVELRVAHMLFIPLALSRSLFAYEFSGLDQSLFKQLGWRHKILVAKLNLSEMSYCNPWEVNPFSFIVWAHGFKDVKNWLVEITYRRKYTSIRKDTAMTPVSWLGYRLFRRFKILICKNPRSFWNILASHGLNPKRDWK